MYLILVEKTIPLLFIGKTEADGVKIKNQLLDLAEKDIIEKSPGKIIIGDYYMTGYVIRSKSIMIWKYRITLK